MKIYLVGGAVRDKLLNRTVKEHDYVVVGSTPNELISLGYQQVGSDFPVFLHPKTKDEYALARTERKSGQGYTGFICDFTPSVTLEEDLIRRDLTINAMAEDEDGTIIDPFNGQHDLNNKLIRHVSDAFSEDPLRILRVARFAARYHYLNFSIAPETLELMTNMVANGEINTLTKERIWLEIDKSLDDGAIYIFSDVLNQIGALGELIPYFQYNWTSELSQQLAALMAKMAKVPESHKQIISFCLWLRHLPLEDCLTLADTLRVPNAYIDALILFNTFARDFAQATPNTAQVLALFNRADIWRRPERFELFINTFKLLGKQQSSLADLLTDAAKNALSVDVQSIIKQGYKGAEIKQQLDIARANAISGVF